MVDTLETDGAKDAPTEETPTPQPFDATPKPNIEQGGAKITTDESAKEASAADYLEAAKAGRNHSPSALGQGVSFFPDLVTKDGATIVHPDSPQRRIEIDYSQRKTRQQPQATAAPAEAGSTQGPQVGGGDLSGGATTTTPASSGTTSGGASTSGSRTSSRASTSSTAGGEGSGSST